MTTLIKKLDNKLTEWYWSQLDGFVEKYKKGKISKLREYLSTGYYHTAFSKKGLEQIKEFEEKAKSVKDEVELENLIKEYHKKVITTELGKWFTTIPVVFTSLIPAEVGSKFGYNLSLVGIIGSSFAALGQIDSMLKYRELSKEDEELHKIVDRSLGINWYFKQKAEEFRQKIKQTNYHS